MQLHIVPCDLLPIYRQLSLQITDAVASGRLRVGDRLPAQRELAEQLVISPLAVKKAYDELKREEIVCTQPGRGTFVSAAAPAVDPAVRRERLYGAARWLAAQAHLVGAPLPELERLLGEVHEELRSERTGQEREADPSSA